MPDIASAAPSGKPSAVPLVPVEPPYVAALRNNPTPQQMVDVARRYAPGNPAVTTFIATLAGQIDPAGCGHVLRNLAQFSGETLETLRRIAMSGQAAKGEILTAEECAALFAGCTFVVERGRILSPKGAFLDAVQFNGAYGGRKFIIDSIGKATDEPWKAALRSTLWTVPKADGEMFRTDQPAGAIVTDAAGRTAVNTYRPAVIEAEPGDVGPFLRHLEAMLPDAGDRKILLDYMAHNVRFPGFKIPWTPVIQSVKGAGKNVIKYAMEHCMGEQYVYPVNSKELAEAGGKFNDWMHRKLLLIADEIKTDDKRHMMEVLKDFISEKTIEMQGKGTKQRKLDNIANWICFTNHRDAIPIDRNERRFAVMFSPLQSKADLVARKMDDVYFNWLYDTWLGHGTHRTGLKHIADFLLNYPIERGAIPMRAPDTSSQDEAIEAGRGWLENLIADAVEAGEAGFRCGWINTVAVARLCRERGKPEPQTNTLAEAIKALGYAWIGRAGRGWFQDDPRNPNVRGYLYSNIPGANRADYGAWQGYPKS